MNRIMAYRCQHDWIQKTVRRTDSDNYVAIVLCNCGQKLQSLGPTEKLASREAKAMWLHHRTNNT